MQGGDSFVKRLSVTGLAMAPPSSDPAYFSTQWAQFCVRPLMEVLCIDTPTSLVPGSHECAQAPVVVGNNGSMDSGEKKAWFEAQLCHLLALGARAT